MKISIEVEGLNIEQLAERLHEAADAISAKIGVSKKESPKNDTDVVKEAPKAKAAKPAPTKSAAPAAKTSNGKAVKASGANDDFELGDEDEDFDATEDSDELNDEGDSDDEMNDDEEESEDEDDVPELSLKSDVIPAFQKYLDKQKKKYKGDVKKAHADAKKILSKFKVSKVQDLKPKQFAEAMNAISA